MASTWMQRAARQASRYMEEAFAEPGAFKICQETIFHPRLPASVHDFYVITDAHLGGLTTAAHRHSTDSAPEDGYIVFEGEYSSVVPREAHEKVHKLGQATLASKLTPGSYLYLGKYERQVATELRLRMKGDGRLYLAYLKTDSYAEGEGTYDIWQTYLQLRPNEWQDLTIPFTDFVLTSDGQVVEETVRPNLQRVAGLGFSVAGGRAIQEDGPFRLEIQTIDAGYTADRSMDE